MAFQDKSWGAGGGKKNGGGSEPNQANPAYVKGPQRHACQTEERAFGRPMEKEPEEKGKVKRRGCGRAGSSLQKKKRLDEAVSSIV